MVPVSYILCLFVYVCVNVYVCTYTCKIYTSRCYSMSLWLNDWLIDWLINWLISVFWQNCSYVTPRRDYRVSPRYTYSPAYVKQKWLHYEQPLFFVENTRKLVRCCSWKISYGEEDKGDNPEDFKERKWTKQSRNRVELVLLTVNFNISLLDVQ